MRHIDLTCAIFAFTTIAASVQSQAASYVPKEGKLNISTGISFTYFDEFYANENLVGTPGGEDIERFSFRNYFFYGLGNNLVADFSFGYADTSGFDVVNGGTDSRSDFTDLQFGLGWQFLEQDIHGFDALFRFGVSLETGYEVGDLQAPGDGANGTDYTLKVGKRFSEHGLRGDASFTYFQRDDGVPDTFMIKAGPTIPITDRFSIDASATYLTSVEDGLDIGGPGFGDIPVGAKPLSNLPLVEEEAVIAEIGFAYSAGDYGYWRLTYSEVLDGRNIGKEQTIGLSYSFGFGLK